MKAWKHGVRVGTLTPTVANLGRRHPRTNSETQISQIGQIGQRVSNAKSRGIAQAAN
jgi:hypothetical protein